jgi:hypothetical protein
LRNTIIEKTNKEITILEDVICIFISSPPSIVKSEIKAGCC